MIRIALAAAIAFAASPALSEDGKIIANTVEKQRQKGRGGYANPIHGHIRLNGRLYPFVSGGRGRGAAPFGEYHIGPLSGFRAPRGAWIPGYHLSDAFDPFVRDERAGLFIHPGRGASAGCIAILPALWHQFVQDMSAVHYSLLELGHIMDEPEFDDSPPPKAHYHRRKHRGKVKHPRHRRRYRHR